MANQTEIPDGIDINLINLETSAMFNLVSGIPFYPLPNNEFTFVGSSLLPFDIPSGSNYVIKASYVNAAKVTVLDVSPLFSVRNSVSPADSPSFEFLNPTSESSTFTIGENNMILWTYIPTILRSDLVNLYLLNENSMVVTTIAESIYNNGVYSWIPPVTLNTTEVYYLSLNATIETMPKQGISGPFKFILSRPDSDVPVVTIPSGSEPIETTPETTEPPVIVDNTPVIVNTTPVIVNSEPVIVNTSTEILLTSTQIAKTATVQPNPPTVIPTSPSNGVNSTAMAHA